MGETPMPPATADKRGTGVPPVGWQKTEMRLWFWLSVAACLCGMATKEVMVTAPVLVLFYDRAFVSGSFQSALAKKRWFYASLAAAWIWLGFLMHRSSLAAASVGFHEGVSWSTYALTELRAVTDYLKLAFWPHPLVFDYGSEILLTDPLAAAPYALIIFAILVGVVIAWRRSPMAGFLGAWFVLILAPTSTVVPIAEQPMAESRMYLPLAAVVVALTLLIYGLGRRKAFAIIGIAAIGLGALTVRRNHDYRSEQRIWEDSLTWQPHTSRGHYNLGVALAKIPDRLSDAIAHYDEALRLKPDFPEAHNNLANALKKIPGRLTDAIAHYEAALRLGSVYAETHYNLANALTQVPGRLPAAIAHYDEALRLKPEYAEAHNNLASILVGMPGRLPEAIAHYEEALRLKPDYADAHFNSAVVLAKMPGRMPEVIAHYEAFIKLTTESAVAHNNLANALVEMPGRLADAITHYEQALRLQPGYAEAHYNFANVLARMPGRMPDAIAHYESAVRNKPDFVEARTNLAAAYAETGRIKAAIEQLEIVVRQDPAAGFARDKLEKLKSMPKQ
jgi:tetratricopeptide (TPR) repeat protein